MKISFYPSIKQTDSKQIVDVVSELYNIKNGVYEDFVYPVRNAKTDKEKKDAKLKAPCFTVSGIFSKRGNDNLMAHSGLIAIDFDHVSDIGDAYNLLINDFYTFSVFHSISGDGLCCIVKIDGKRHLDAFLGLEKYYFRTYGLEADRACKDVSRPRYVSYDPDLFLYEDSEIFKNYLPKENKQEIKKFQSFKFSGHFQSKFELVLSRIKQDITQNYSDWIKIGFAIASEYGENGLDYFKQISQFHPEYDEYKCERKYRSLLSDKSSGIKIASFYYVCQSYGIDITDEREEKSRELAVQYKKQGKTGKQLIQEIPSVIAEVVNEEFKKPTASKSNEFNVEIFQQWLQANYDIKKNEVTRFYELNGNQLEQSDINTIYIDAKKIFSKVSKDLVESVIFSNYTPTYNPIKLYFKGLKWDGVDYVAKLGETITSNTGDFIYREFALRQWLIGIVESILKDKPNILCLVLAGLQNTGKSTFFTKLLPSELKKYFALSQLDRGKDDEILMCQSLIIFDDEFSGKSKQDAKHMKRILSAPSFTLREPYGRQNVTLKRIATLCGTCNELDVLNDPTGNRRFIVFEVTGQFDYDLYNSIDKGQLFAQVVDMVKRGHTADLGHEFIKQLEQNSEEFVEVSIEMELIDEYFTQKGYPSFKTATMIKDFLEKNTNQKLSIKKLGMALNQLKFNRVKQNGRYGYLLASKQTF